MNINIKEKQHKRLKIKSKKTKKAQILKHN